MKLKKISLKLSAEKFYEIEIGAGAIQSLPKWVSARNSKKVVLIYDQRLKAARKTISALFGAGEFDYSEISVKAGETLKDIQSVYPLYGELLKMKADRDTLLIALGGGSVGDAAGFVASTYLRGIDWVGIPTTLLSQVDSSVGGKTGINHADGKNLIGSFYQPKRVIVDLDFLKTLGTREVISGLGEIVKYALTFDAKFFSYLEVNRSKLLTLDSAVLQKAIEKSLVFKCQAVAHDEHDRTGVREVLNFGHTFAHSLEALTDYKIFQHGEAVLWGMRFALALSIVRQHLDLASYQKIDAFLKLFKVPALPTKVTPVEYFALMKKDKKSSAGKVRFVLLKKLGQTCSDADISSEDLHQAYALIDNRKKATLG